MNNDEKVMDIYKTLVAEINDIKSDIKYLMQTQSSLLFLVNKIEQSHIEVKLIPAQSLRLLTETKDAISIMTEKLLHLCDSLDKLTVHPDYVLKSDYHLSKLIVDRHTREIEAIQEILDSQFSLIKEIFNKSQIR